VGRNRITKAERHVHVTCHSPEPVTHQPR
jgi:hypothetical protein